MNGSGDQLAVTCGSGANPATVNEARGLARVPPVGYRDVSDADEAAEAAWLRANVIGPGETRIDAPDHAKDRCAGRCWGWRERLGIALEWDADRSWGDNEAQPSSGGRNREARVDNSAQA